ncbi:MAG: toxin-antitoxin system YwqK family antitoxin [Flavobacteriales bacterium]
MKNLTLLFILLCTLSLPACTAPKKKESAKEVAPEELVEIKDGHYKEWYPGKKHLKYEGELNKKGEREGKWNFYSEKGTLLSFTFYQSGKKEGYSVVKYPNGKIHYYGQYQNDKMVGEWVTYDAKGQKTIQNFDLE